MRRRHKVALVDVAPIVIKYDVRVGITTVFYYGFDKFRLSVPNIKMYIAMQQDGVIAGKYLSRNPLSWHTRLYYCSVHSPR